MSANEIPDDLWRQILEIGVKSSTFTYKDLCCISISSRRLCRLSCDDSLWDLLLVVDFPYQIVRASSSQCPTKFIYRKRYGFEREKERKVAAYRRALMTKEMEISEWAQRIRELVTRLPEETERLDAASVEFSNLHKVRQASVDLNVWQLEVVLTRQKSIVGQNAVPVEARLQALEMEMKLFEQQIMGFRKTLWEVTQRSDKAIKELEFMQDHPLRDYESISNGDHLNDSMRMELKTSINSLAALPKTKYKLLHAESE